MLLHFQAHHTGFSPAAWSRDELLRFSTIECLSVVLVPGTTASKVGLAGDSEGFRSGESAAPQCPPAAFVLGAQTGWASGIRAWNEHVSF